MTAILLENSLFDDGSFECFNFFLAHDDGTDQVDSKHPFIEECKAEIEAAMSRGERHIQVKSGLVFAGLTVYEIQWG